MLLPLDALITTALYVRSLRRNFQVMRRPTSLQSPSSLSALAEQASIVVVSLQCGRKGRLLALVGASRSRRQPPASKYNAFRYKNRWASWEPAFVGTLLSTPRQLVVVPRGTWMIGESPLSPMTH